MTTTADPFAGYLFEPVEAPRFATADRRPWVVYGRISKVDPHEGAGAHVKIGDQLAQCRAYVLALDPGAEVLEFRDNASAYIEDVPRPGFERLIAMLAAGEVKGVVAIHVDRLLRQVRHAALVWGYLDRTGAQLHTAHGGYIQDPTMMQMEAVMAERESRVKRDRQRNHHRRLAEDGKPHGGRRRFGYTNDMSELNMAEAEALRSIAARVLGGESLASCVRWLKAEGFEGTAGGNWTGSNLATMLKRPMLAGLRVHGQREDGTWRVVAKATWPPVFDLATHEALLRKLGDPARRTAPDKPNVSKYLLPGIGRCACGEVLRGRTGRKDKARVAYVCATGRHVYREQALVDLAVSEAIIGRLERVDSAGVFTDETAEAEEARLLTMHEALVARRKSYAAKAAAGLIGEDMATEVAAAIATELAAVGKALDTVREAAARPLAVLDGMTGPLAREAWERAPIGRRRELVRLFVETLILHGGQREWDPEKLLTLEWRRRPGLA